ncbi:MAG: VanZ family protein [Desulfobulbaceae bacterium]|nr:VanZ family protein [Desulfobulbaceae bacterium]
MASDWHWPRIIPLASVMGMIFFLSHQDGGTLGKLSLPAIPHIDKAAHFVMYGTLAAAALYALPASLLRRYPHRTAWAIIVSCLVYGITDEVHQGFIAGRDTSISDLAADFLGAAFVVLLWCRKQMKSLPFPVFAGR